MILRSMRGFGGSSYYLASDYTERATPQELVERGYSPQEAMEIHADMQREPAGFTQSEMDRYARMEREIREAQTRSAQTARHVAQEGNRQRVVNERGELQHDVDPGRDPRNYTDAEQEQLDLERELERERQRAIEKRDLQARQRELELAQEELRRERQREIEQVVSPGSHRKKPLLPTGPQPRKPVYMTDTPQPTQESSMAMPLAVGAGLLALMFLK